MSIIFRNTNNQKHSTQTKFKTAFSEKPRETIAFPDKSPWTKQEFKDEADINNIMGKYIASGEMPIINQQAPQYLDVTNVDYQDAMNFVAGAQTLFNEMPSSIRNRFGNDPGLFLDFCSNPSNRPEMATLGLLRPDSDLTGVPGAGQQSAAPADSQEPTTTNSPSSSKQPE